MALFADLVNSLRNRNRLFILFQPAGGLVNCSPVALNVFQSTHRRSHEAHHTNHYRKPCLGLALFSGCATLDGHEGAVVGTALGVAGGAAVGASVAGKGNRGSGAAVGALIGGVAGGLTGDQLHDKK